jgi:hypothetical protein
MTLRMSCSNLRDNGLIRASQTTCCYQLFVRAGKGHGGIHDVIAAITYSAKRLPDNAR